MTLAKGTKAVLVMLGLAYAVFLSIFLYQSMLKRGLKTVPTFETVKKELPDPEDEKALEEFAKTYVEVELLGDGDRKGRYRIKQLRPKDVKQKALDGRQEILAALKVQAGKAESFAKKRYLTAAPIKARHGKIVLPRAVELGLMQIELLTRRGIAGVKEIPVQGHGEIIGINATMGFVILNFFILVALLYGLLWEPVTKMLDERAASIRKDIEQASASREDAEKLKARYEQAIANARVEAGRLRQEKVREADEEKDKIIKHAREEARRLLDDAQAQIAAAIADAKHELRKDIGAVAVQIAQQILAREVDPELHRQMIDEFLANLETEKV